LIKTLTLSLVVFTISSGGTSSEGTDGHEQVVATDVEGEKEFRDLVKQYDQDGTAQPGGPKIGPGGFAERCPALADRNPEIRDLSLIEATRRAPDTPGALDAADRFIGGFAADPNYVL
jgi:hypothetical protein